jgi:hypothetical protein
MGSEVASQVGELIWQPRTSESTDLEVAVSA